jgi:exonuclease III
MLCVLLLTILCFLSSAPSNMNTGTGTNLTVSAINCNSLNMSHASKKNQTLKIHGISKLKTDVIFLSDIRLSNKNLVSAAEDVKKIFLTNVNGSYDFFYNSTKNKRGVGILIKSTIGFSVADRWDDPDENFLVLKGSLAGETYILGSCYGPNELYPDFFERLTDVLRPNVVDNIILGGDWNCLFSNDTVQFNIDCINQANCPNAGNTASLLHLCDELSLTDPYRYLFPDRKDYSYVPKDKSKNNRSRLDFFLVSAGLLPIVNKCDIMPGLQNSLFDHKAVILEIGSVPPLKKKFRIRNTGLNIDTLSILIECAVAETYLFHADTNVVDQLIIDQQLFQIGLLKSNCREIKYPFEYWPPGSFDGNDVIRRMLQVEQLKIRCRELNIDRISDLQLNVDYLIFFEVLLNNVKNEIISFQSHFAKWSRSAITGMRTTLINLKKNYDTNFDRINEVEFKLNSILDMEARSELENFAVFEILNLEQMSPSFLNIAKQTRSASKMSDIKDDAGNEFRSDEDRKKFIVNYYANIYKIKDDTDLNLPGCVENFLGPDICNTPEVRNSKISEAQKNMLDEDITLNELNLAIKDMSTKSAGGPDGVGVPVLKKFWYLFQKPLGHYCRDMMRLEKLSPGFLTSAIKLIPKKGDTTKIKNWRPISLLNVSYKIISKAINNRLKKVSGTILSRAQKGFTNNRYIQECIINILESIAFCTETNSQGFLLAIDQAKAFDTVDHKFIKEVYKFFGFGDRFIKMLEITMTGRNACILFDDGEYSGRIILGTGFTQGNGPSPLLFNFCQQILIFKIEFNPLVKAIEWPRVKCDIINVQARIAAELIPVAEPAPPQPAGEDQERAAVPVPAPESPPPAPLPAPLLPVGEARELADPVPAPGTPPPVPVPPPPVQVGLLPTVPQILNNTGNGKVEGFADDTTVLSKAEREALESIKTDLLLFARVSGLKVNFDKCILIPVGFQGPIPQYFYDSGFKIDDNAKILGFNIFNDLNRMSSNFDNVISAVINVRNFWCRFNLSLPGRIAVAKTLMLSRIGYIGCILDPEPDQMETLRNLIYTFVKGRLNVAANRITLPVSHGGLGMIDLQDFLTALRCSWVKRAHLVQNDLWSACLKFSGVTNPDNFSVPVLNAEMFPVLSKFASSVKLFTVAALSVNNNIVCSKLCGNPVFGSKFAGRLFNNHVFENEPNNGKLFCDITLNDIMDNFSLPPRLELSNKLGLEISVNTYALLFRAHRDLISVGILKPTPDTRSCNVSTILTKPKKGSRPYRELLTRAKLPKKCTNINIFKKFCVLTEVTLDPDPAMGGFNSWWNFFGVGNKIREFLFKFCNNLLGVNCRVAHFNRNISEGCTFCSINKRFPVPRETFSHVFFHCPESESVLSGFENKYLLDLALDSVEKRKLFWFFGSIDPGLKIQKKFFLLTAGIIQYYIWDCKLRKCKQSLASCLNFYFYHMDTVRKVSSNLRAEMNDINLDLCRYWHGERPRGW